MNGLADLANKCSSSSPEEAKKLWEAGFKEVQAATDKAIGPAIKSEMEAATSPDKIKAVWFAIEEGYRQ